MRILTKFSGLTTFLHILVFYFSISPAFSAVSPWCDEEGNSQYPLSFEVMAQGPLLPPEVRRNPTKAIQVISDIFVREQNELIISGTLSETDPDVQAFRRLLQAQIAGENLKTHFQFSIDPVSGNAKLIWPKENRQLLFDCVEETPKKLISSNPQKANIGYAASLVYTILSKQLQVFDKYYSNKVAQRADEYYRYMSEGLPMWPWELAINGLGEDYNDLFAEAPRWQWVVARPSAGLELIWPNRKQATLEASIGVEPIGFVRYTDKSYKNWWGISTLVTLGTDDNGVGLGGLVRYNNYSLGIIKREDIDDAYLFFSFDLYGKVRDTETRLLEAKHNIEKLKHSWMPN